LSGGQFSLQQSSSPPPPGVPSPEESKFYYYGLPSQPRLVARTTTTPWEASDVAELRPCNHKALNEALENDLPEQLFGLLDELKIKWTSVDIVRIARTEDAWHAPVILWLGVMPESLSGEKGVELAVKCKKLLLERGISDVDCEIRESKVWPQITAETEAPQTRKTRSRKKECIAERKAARRLKAHNGTRVFH
jgi:hypothetical protein